MFTTLYSEHHINDVVFDHRYYFHNIMFTTLYSQPYSNDVVFDHRYYIHNILFTTLYSQPYINDVVLYHGHSVVNIIMSLYSRHYIKEHFQDTISEYTPRSVISGTS